MAALLTLAAIAFAIRFASTSTIRCRSAHLVFVQPNHLLSAIHIVLVMRTAASTAMPPWQAKTKQRKSEVGGNCVRPPTRRQSDSEDRRKSNRLDTSSSRHLIAQRVQFFKPQSDNTKSFSWGSKGDILFCEREYPPLTHAAPLALLPRGTRAATHFAPEQNCTENFPKTY